MYYLLKYNKPEMTVDVHHHYFGESMMAELDAMLTDRIGPEASMSRYYESDEVGLSTEEPAERVQMMDEWGLERAVLSFPAPGEFVDERHLKRPEIHAAFSSIVNDHLADACQQHPDRLLGFASIPLVSVDDAVEELQRSVETLGLHGIVLDTNVFGRYLTDESFAPFFERADDLGVPIFVHPANPGGADRMDDFYLESMIGFPFDTTLAATRMVFSGVLERYRDLNIVLSHLGGALPYLVKRLAALYDPDDPEFERGAVHPLEKPPERYLEDFWYDTALSFPGAMDMAVDLVGDRLLLGSDYPFGPADSVAESIDQVTHLEDPDLAAHVRGANARSILLNLD
ncbi:hypothetical protein BRC81_05800 [Halobacteriales archaeon QS_1_68_20]|nr:MAG: hypothetical protein BRC81_05800 [Halobacteriales archaeon QS_1_68_20]